MCVLPLTPSTVPLRQHVPVVNALSRFKKLIPDWVGTLMYNFSLFPMKTGNNTALPHTLVWGFSRTKPLRTDRVSDTVMMGVTHDSALLLSVHIQRKQRCNLDWDIPQKKSGRPHKRGMSIKSVCEENSFPETHRQPPNHSKTLHPLAHFSEISFAL